MNRAHDTVAVIGLGFGDEGKGHVVDWLCSKLERPTVVRYSGGSQAEHHVVMPDGADHLFSHFGSGTLRNVQTYWSEYCLVNPVALVNEYLTLKDKGVSPMITIHPKCPVVTPYEIAWNERGCGLGDNGSETREHGSCGVGIFATVKRERDNYRLLFEDLFHPLAFREKMIAIQCYYRFSISESEWTTFKRACDMITGGNGPAYKWIPSDDQLLFGSGSIVFEGSQGLLLDQNYGFFPHVTPSNVGTTNIVEMGFEPEIYLVTRAYQTRHGNGPMSQIEPNDIKDNPFEVIAEDGCQGPLRKTLLDLDMIRYAVAKDEYISSHPRTLVITCMDLMAGDYRLFDQGDIVHCNSEFDFVTRIKNAAQARDVLLSYGPTAEDIKEI